MKVKKFNIEDKNYTDYQVLKAKERLKYIKGINSKRKQKRALKQLFKDICFNQDNI